MAGFGQFLRQRLSVGLKYNGYAKKRYRYTSYILEHSLQVTIKTCISSAKRYVFMVTCNES